MMQLAPRIQEYFAFAGQVLGELVRDDQVRFDAVRVRAHGCIGQGLQSLVRFRRRERTCEQHHVVRWFPAISGRTGRVHVQDEA